MNRFVTFALFLSLVALVNSVPLMLERQYPQFPVLLLTNQQSLDAANEAANSNQLDISASNANEFANSLDFDQADNLIVSKRNIVPYSELNIPYSQFVAKRDVTSLPEIERNLNRDTDVEKRLVGTGPALGLLGSGSTFTNFLPFLAFGGAGVNGLAASSSGGSFSNANALGY